MNTDPIVAELHQQRRDEMERFNFDFEAFCRYLKEQEKLSTELLLHFNAEINDMRLLKLEFGELRQGVSNDRILYR